MPQNNPYILKFLLFISVLKNNFSKKDQDFLLTVFGRFVPDDLAALTLVRPKHCNPTTPPPEGKSERGQGDGKWLKTLCSIIVQFTRSVRSDPLPKSQILVRTRFSYVNAFTNKIEKLLLSSAASKIIFNPLIFDPKRVLFKKFTILKNGQ